MKNSALFLDRDGTLNFDSGYLGNPDKVELYPGVGEGISELKKKLNFKIIVISNQAGITRGLITKAEVELVNDKINYLLNEYDTCVDKFYYCPTHPDFDPPEKVTCRKPSPEMIFKAAEDFNIDLSSSYMIGDKLSDIECAVNAGVASILFLNGKNEGEINLLKKAEKTPNFVADNFYNACKFILTDYMEKNI